MTEQEKRKQASPYTQAPPGQQAPPGPQAFPGAQRSPEQQETARQQAPSELLNKLKNKDSNVRRSAAETIGIMGDNKAVDYLIVLLKDDNRFVRQETVRALGKIGGAMALETLTQALFEEKDEFVKDFIKKAVEKLQPK
ncbi:MAG: HEAT repeat domain-containing protein [Dehalococcoidales bacterium]|nr:HEAT repeat domain-containing protein [Dehalococcoidales bacterium]